ncbi:histidine kinase [Oscillospiraceae bacterium N12]|jgi:two-component sensor histidine kinase|uniref:Histidine kinase n=1 Tax=Jilunia laotingensis TaxID=2763675 RepID=A0A926F4Y1_9BACT|nr:histidine kinase [Jilunia laotingensis]MBC8594776.1 histidine kinase [Jilunia laotingensis]
MKTIINSRTRFTEVSTHVIGWGIVFGFPFFFINRGGESIDWMGYLRHVGVPLSFLIVFYLNYFILIPRYLFNERLREYLLLNLALIILMSGGLHLWQSFVFSNHNPVKPPKNIPPGWIFFVRDMFSMVLTIGLAAAIKMSTRWGQIENARREAERNRTEAELKNLRNQLNPHFLLNTLNNIYALIAFDSDKAQMAVQELSKLLRHVLYDNQQTYVSLGKEMDFIRNYIELMRIRLSSNVKVETYINIDPDNRTEIAPLIFISLIENAFKHGISPTEPSFIRIVFSETNGEVKCEITNSYHPKAETDKSGSGIGLEQVSKRLALIYPGRYKWERKISEDKKEYSSKLVISI